VEDGRKLALDPNRLHRTLSRVGQNWRRQQKPARRSGGWDNSRPFQDPAL
jgi:hypothetical protein